MKPFLPLFAGFVLVLKGAATLAAPLPCGEHVENAEVASPGKPSEPLAAKIVACTRIASPAKRLDCYDALTGHSD